MTNCIIRPTTQPRTDANAFTLGETDTSGDIAYVIWEVQAAASSGVTQALNGSASSSAAGTLAPSHSGDLSGQAATASAGTLAPSHSQALAGSAVTASAGTLIGSKDAVLAGQAATAAAGTVAPEHAQALSGQAATASAGTITYTAGVAAALTGQEATASAGTVAPEHAQALTGQAATAAAGTITFQSDTAVNVALGGEAASASAGTLAPSHTQALSGEAVSASAGTLSYTSETLLEVALTGQSMAADAGTLSPAVGLLLAGSDIVCDAGDVTISGTDAVLRRDVGAGKRTRRRRYIIEEKLYELTPEELAFALESLAREPEDVRHVKRLSKTTEAKIQKAKARSLDRAVPLAYVPISEIMPELAPRLEPLDTDTLIAVYEALQAQQRDARIAARRAEEELMILALVAM